jgi:hypothetical protein
MNFELGAETQQMSGLASGIARIESKDVTRSAKSMRMLKKKTIRKKQRYDQGAWRSKSLLNMLLGA